MYELHTKKLHALIEDLLKYHDIKFHMVESRTKSVESFNEKIARPNKNYSNPIEEILDLSGIRIIVHYNDDVYKVADLLEKEFIKIECEDRHQANNYNVDSFGYLSLHYIVELDKKRTELFEWAQFKGIRTEIQIRTVLQHGWATLSHAMQYKREDDVPKDLRRKLYRLAGLFELADEELLSIRIKSEQASLNDRQKISSGNKNVKITPSSLHVFMETWAKTEELKKILLAENFIIEDDIGQGDDRVELNYYGDVARECERIGIKTIADLEIALDLDYEFYLSNVHQNPESPWYVSPSFILYLCFIRAFQDKFSFEHLTKYGWEEDIAAYTLDIARKALENSENQ